MNVSAHRKISLNRDQRAEEDLRTEKANIISFAPSREKLGQRKSAQRIAEKCVGLIGIAIPRPILVAEDLNRQHNASGSEIVLFADTGID